MPVRVAACLVVVLLAVSACSDSAESDGRSLEVGEWILASGVEARPGDVPTVAFAGGFAVGFAGCNSYGGDYELDGSSLSIGEIGASAMSCDDPAMKTEEAYLTAFGTVDGWRVEDGELVLTAGGDEMLRYGRADALTSSEQRTP